MKIKVERVQRDDDVTIGVLTIEGSEFSCYTLEDPVREIPGAPVSEWKVYGKTAIPVGTYAVSVTYSPRFNTPLPLLAAVPGFEGVRIHAGNFARDTEGCLLVGLQRAEKSIVQSRAAMGELLPIILDAQRRGERVTIEIV